MRRISGDIDFDLRRKFELLEFEKTRKRRDSRIGPALTSKVNRMNDFDDFIQEVDNNLIKCAFIVESKESAELMDQEYRKIRYAA